MGPDFEPIRAQGRHGDLKCDGHRAERVERYFNDTGKVEQGEKIGKQFANFYKDMMVSGYDPNHIFFEFVDICGGVKRPQGQRNAVLAVVAYYFNRCDIFENELVLA